MPFRARDTTCDAIKYILFYPRADDFPVEYRDLEAILVADVNNITEELMLQRDFIVYNTINPINGLAVYAVCKAIIYANHNGGVRRITEVSYFGPEDPPKLMARAYYITPAPLGVIEFDDSGTLRIGGKPTFVITMVNIKIDYRFILAGLWRTPNVEVSYAPTPGPGWTREEVTEDDVCTLPVQGGATTVLSNWIIDHEEYVAWFLHEYLTNPRDRELLNVYKVTYAVDGLGYAEFVSREN